MDHRKNKELYEAFCREHRVPVFCRPFWLNEICGEDWTVLITEEKGKPEAFLPLALKRKFGFAMLIPSPMTVFNGPFFASDLREDSSKMYSHYRKHFRELKKAASNFSRIQFQTFPEFTYHLALNTAGFEVTPRTTHVIRDFENAEYRSSIRRKIKKAERELEIDEIDFDDFYGVNRLTFSRKNIPMPYDRERMKSAVRKAAEKKHALILGARTKADKELCGGIIFLTDETGIYLFLSGMNPKLKEWGSQPFLTHTGIQLARQSGVPFYFFGSNRESIARFFEGLGGEAENYFVGEEYGSFLFEQFKKRLSF